MFIFILILPILSEVISKISGVPSASMLLKVFGIAILFFYWADFRKVKSILLLVISSLFFLSSMMIFEPRFLITALADLFVLLFFTFCLININRRQPNSLVTSESLYKAIFYATLFVFIGVAMNIANVLSFSVLPDLSMPSEHSVRYVSSGEMNLISGFFASSKKLGKYCLILALLTCFIMDKNKKHLLHGGLLILVLLSGSREALYCILLIFLFDYVRVNLQSLLSLALMSSLLVFVFGYFEAGFYFSQSSDVSNRLSGYLFMVSNLNLIEHHGFGLLGRSVSLLGIDNIPGIVPYEFKGAAHDSTILWLYVCFGYLFIFPVLYLIVVLTITSIKSRNRLVLCALIILCFNIIKAQSTMYDFYFIFFFLLGIQYVAFSQEYNVNNTQN